MKNWLQQSSLSLMRNIQASVRNYFAYRPTVFLFLYLAYAFLGIYFINPESLFPTPPAGDLFLSVNFPFVYWAWPRTVEENIGAAILLAVFTFPFFWFELRYQLRVKAQQKAQAKVEAKAQALAEEKAKWEALWEAFEERIETELQELKKALKRAEATNTKLSPVFGWRFYDHEQLAMSSIIVRQEQVGFVKDNFLYIQKDLVHFLSINKDKYVFYLSLDTSEKVYLVHQGELDKSKVYLEIIYNNLWSREQRREQRQKQAFAAHVFQAYSVSKDHKYVKGRIFSSYTLYEMQTVLPPPSEVPPSGLDGLSGLLGAILVSVSMGVKHYVPSCLSHTATPSLFINTDKSKKSREKKPMNWKRFLPWLF